jgi:hypothetical protein
MLMLDDPSIHPSIHPSGFELSLSLSKNVCSISSARSDEETKNQQAGRQEDCWVGHKFLDDPLV